MTIYKGNYMKIITKHNERYVLLKKVYKSIFRFLNKPLCYVN